MTKDNEPDVSGPAPDITTGEVLSKAYAGPGEWLPIAAGAYRLGVHERTLRRWLDEGLYQRRSAKGRTQVFVPLSGPAPDSPDSEPDTSGDPPDTTLDVSRPAPDALGLAILEEMKRQDQEKTERLTRQAEEIGKLKAELAASEARAALLDADLKAARDRPWWRRIWE